MFLLCETNQGDSYEDLEEILGPFDLFLQQLVCAGISFKDRESGVPVHHDVQLFDGSDFVYLCEVSGHKEYAC